MLAGLRHAIETISYAVLGVATVAASRSKALFQRAHAERLLPLDPASYSPAILIVAITELNREITLLGFDHTKVEQNEERDER